MGETPLAVLEICRVPSAVTYALAEALKAGGQGGVLTAFEMGPSPVRKKFNRLLGQNELQDHVTIMPVRKSYHWALQRLINDERRPRFDICVLNGNRRWDAVALTAYLADILLRPGGLMIAPGLKWSIESSPYFQRQTAQLAEYDKDEIAAHPLELVRDTVLPRLNYRIIEEPNCPQVLFARKPK
ncbi:hypothetical protein SAMN04488044_1685 [Cognatishimia maritima]|uniref:Methyltransferase n=2 Tax=Cognatishimia maritima TaxID=870908 RepID=A0A1M5P153_9RHOB|nr:hypothetical protein SAMN04488044_1685 [Cognatishimia maritima]